MIPPQTKPETIVYICIYLYFYAFIPSLLSDKRRFLRNGARFGKNNGRFFKNGGRFEKFSGRFECIFIQSQGVTSGVTLGVTSGATSGVTLGATSGVTSGAIIWFLIPSDFQTVKCQV